MMGELLPVPQARALIAAAMPESGSENLAVGDAAGRVLAEPCVAGRDLPLFDRAALDGYAVRATDTAGAGDYTPMTLVLRQTSDRTALSPGSAAAVTRGQPLPDGADAVLPFEAASPSGAEAIEVLAQAAPGAGIERRGSELAAGSPALARGRRLRPQDVALLTALGETRVRVLRRLRVGLIVPGPKAGEADALTPMLRALLARDGAIVEEFRPALLECRAVTGAIARGAATSDVLLVAGGSGAGADDKAASAIANAGGVRAFHGVAIHPGESAGLWRMGEVPVLLLPGAPLACLVTYDVTAAPPLRQEAGLGPDDAYAAVDARLDRKIVSGIGSTEIVRVMLSSGRATPLGMAGLASVAHADGFVLVPASREGYPAGASVRVHLYDASREGQP